MSSIVIQAVIYKLVAIGVIDSVGYYYFWKTQRKIIGKLLALGSLNIVLLIMYKFLKQVYIFNNHMEIWHFV